MEDRVKEKAAPEEGGAESLKTKPTNSGTADKDQEARKAAAKAAWKAAPPFPIAANPSGWKQAVTAALKAITPKAVAQAYIKHGIPVIPCNPIERGDNSKRTFVSVYEGSIDPAQIEAWWTKYPDALTGVPMGRRVGVFAIDIDSPDSHKHDGLATFRKLEAEYDPVTTRRHLTAGNGHHAFFLWDANRPIGTALGNLPKEGGIEVKGEGGQVIFPGSVLRNGRKWSVADDQDPQRGPEWLLDILLGGHKKPSASPGNGSWSPGYGMKRLDEAVAALAAAGPGERNAAAGRWAMPIGHYAAGGAFEGVLTIEEVRARLMDAARANGAGAKYVDDVKRAYENGLKEPAAPVSAWLDYKDFVAYMPTHGFIYRPTREFWVTKSVDERVPSMKIKVGDKEISIQARGASDTLAAVKLLRTMSDIDPTRIFLLGYSWGAISSLFAVDAASPTSRDANVAGLIAYYPYCWEKVDPTVPTLIMIVEKDDWTPAALCEKVQGKQNVEVVVYGGDTHGFTTPMDQPVDYLGHHMVYDQESTEDAQDRADVFLDVHMDVDAAKK